MSLLEDVHEALNAWIHTYAPDMCDEERVEHYRNLISDHGGTLYYIAELNKLLAAAMTTHVLVPREPTEGMLGAGTVYDSTDGFSDIGADVKGIYKAMLSAAEKEK
jgi:hypothetical protein